MNFIARSYVITILGSFPFYTFGLSINNNHATIVKNDSSILIGYVQNHSESVLSREVAFKMSPTDKITKTIPIKEINRIVFSEDSLIFCAVPYHRRIDTLKTTEYRLAKKILSGYADLYKMQLPPSEYNIVFETNNTFVYIVTINGVYSVLDQTEKLEGTTYKIRKGYVGTLRSILKGHEELQKKLPKIKFRDSHIIPLIAALNAEHKEIPSKTFPFREKPQYLFGLSVGHTTFNDFDHPPLSGFITGCRLEICNPEISKKLVSSFGLSAIFLSDNITIRTRKSHVLVGLPISAEYHFFNLPVSPFISIGVTLYPQLLEVPLRMASGISILNSYTLGYSLESVDPWFRSEKTVSFYVSYRARIGK